MLVTATATATAAPTASPPAAAILRSMPRSGDCVRFASPAGSDRAAGTSARPVRTVRRLLSMLGPGMTGCLEGGRTFPGRVYVRKGGAPGRPIELRSYGRGRATIRGDLTVAGSNVVIRNLVLDGAQESRASPYVLGDDDWFVADNVTTQNRGICYLIGETPRRALRTRIVRNRIHDCGRLPATGLDHGIYLASSEDAAIIDNFVYRNADYGIQVYPDSQRTAIYDNVIADNGRGIVVGGDDGHTSNDARIARNVIANPATYAAVAGWWGGEQGGGNVASDNCIWTSRGVPAFRGSGIAIRSNRRARPLFLAAATGDYRQSPRSPCARYGTSATP